MSSPLRMIGQRGRRLRPWGRSFVALLLVLWPLFTSAEPATVRLALAPEPNPRLGVVFVDGVSPYDNQPYPNARSRYDKAKALGASFTRWPMYWHLIEPSQDNFQYSSQDQVTDLDMRNGLEVNAILMGTPSWGGVATSDVRPGAPQVGPHIAQSSGASRFGAGSYFAAGSAGAVPVGLDMPPLNPDGSINQQNRWAYFVYKTVRRYMPGGDLARERSWPQGRGIRHWEMWNEPDFVLENGAPVFWEGGVQNYYRLLKVGYLAAKAADPQATVLFGGLQYWSGQKDFFARVLDQIMTDPDAKSKNYFFDVVPFHLYINPYNLLDVGQWAKSEMSKRGIAKAVWVNETNIPVYDDPNVADSPFCPGWQGTQDEQASFVVQASALALAAGVERVFLFQLYDDNVGYREYYGLVRNDGSLRPSFTAFQVAATYLANPVSPQRTQLEAGAVDSVSFYNPKQGRVTVLWNTDTAQKTVSLAAATPSAQLIDKLGNAQQIAASNNRFSINLPGRAYYDIGGCTKRFSDQPGSPYILVEPVNTQISSQVNPLPETATQVPFNVSWSRLDQVGGTATYDIQFRAGRQGEWQNWLTDTAQTSAAFGAPEGAGKTYYFRSRAKVAGGLEPYPDGDGDAFTTVKLYFTGRVVDNRGRPITQATVAAATSGVNTTSTASGGTDGQGTFSLELPAAGTYQVTVSKQGYGGLPAKELGVSTSIAFDFALPPSNNAVQNWGFESGLSGWVTSGTVLTQTFRHSGSWGATISKTGAISQTVAMPVGNVQSALSFFYRTPNPSAGDRFEVVVAGSRTASYVFPLSNNTWQQGWIDTSGFQGPVEVRFRFSGAGDLWLDEVSLGGPHWMYLPMVTQSYSLGW